MPELPEVETVVRQLRRTLIGKTLRRFFIYDPRLESPGTRRTLGITSVERLGKYIVLGTKTGSRCLIHLRMTGGLFFHKTARAREGRKRHPHLRARFLFSDGSDLRFVDARRFGTIQWFGQDNRWEPALGADPLSSTFNAAYLRTLGSGRSRAIKSLLLDQRCIAGIGNIYADEGLWLAGIHPQRPSNALNDTEWQNLAVALPGILQKGIRQGGFTLRDWRAPDGQRGRYQLARNVYGRADQPCRRCKTPIRKIRVASRGTHYCPRCQALKPKPASAPAEH